MMENDFYVTSAGDMQVKTSTMPPLENYIEPKVRKPHRRRCDKCNSVYETNKDSYAEIAGEVYGLCYECVQKVINFIEEG